MIEAGKWAKKMGVPVQAARDWARRGNLGTHAEIREVQIKRWFIDTKCKAPTYKQKQKGA